MQFPKSNVALYISLVMTALAAQMADARTLDLDEALARALESPGAVRAAVRRGALTLAYTGERDGRPLLYVVNRGEGDGFMFLAADDCFMPMPAYAVEGTFSADDMPQGMAALTAALEESVARAIEAGVPARAESATPESRATPVANLLTAAWDQGYPYYNMAPTVNGRYCYTGCVATAMAQVMHYYRWPQRGTGSHSYTWNSQTLTADFGATEYRWDDMLPSYNWSSPTAACDAVAELMYHCGVSVDMSYGTGASAANVYKVAGAMVDYFGYDDGIRVNLRRSYSLNDWNQLVYDELAAGRPVLYSGSDNNVGGHFFVVCGADGNDYFNINWGWGGSYNGLYCKLNALNASGYGFNSDQVAVMGIRPADDVDDSAPNMVGMGQLNLYYKTYGQTYPRRTNSTEYFMPTASDAFYGFYNMDRRTVTPMLGAIFENVETGETLAAEAYGYTPKTMAIGENVRYFQIHHNQFPTSGTWRMYPAANVDGTGWTRIPFDISSPQYFVVTCTATDFVFEKPMDNLPVLVVDSVEPPSDVRNTNSYFNIPLTVANIGDGPYSGNLSIYYRNESDIYWWVNRVHIELEAEETLDTYFQLKHTAPGRYTAYVKDDSDKRLTGEFRYVVKNPFSPARLALSGEPTIELAEAAVPLAAGPRRAEGASSITATMPVTCTQGYYLGYPTADIADADGNTVGSLASVDEHSIYEGSSKDIVLKGTAPTTPGVYSLTLGYTDDSGNPAVAEGHDEQADNLAFTVADASRDDETVTSLASLRGGDGDGVTAWTLSGVRVYTGDAAHLASLPTGFYVLSDGRRIFVRR